MWPPSERSADLGVVKRRARSEALERLVPKAIQVLEQHLESGRPDAWRSAHRILEQYWGKPPDYIAPTALDDVEIDNLDELSTPELAALVKRLREKRIAAEHGDQPESAADATPLAAVASG